MFVTSFKKFIRQIVLTAVCVIPTIHLKLESEEAYEKVEDEVE